MRRLLGCCVALCCVAAAPSPDPLYHLYARWERDRRDVRSLVVEMTQDTKDRTFGTRQLGDVTIRLVRTKQGELFGSFEGEAKSPSGGPPERSSFLLMNKAFYVLLPEKKTAVRYDFANDEDLTRFLIQHYNPAMFVLQTKPAEDTCKLAFVKRDEWYTYLAAKPSWRKDDPWWRRGGTFAQGHVAVLNKPWKGVPKDVPVQLWYSHGSGTETTFDVKAWKVNAADGPKRAEFIRPEDRPGWEVNGRPSGAPGK